MYCIECVRGSMAMRKSIEKLTVQWSSPQASWLLSMKCVCRFFVVLLLCTRDVSYARRRGFLTFVDCTQESVHEEIFCCGAACFLIIVVLLIIIIN